jgi:hypothetical protein
MSCTSKSAAAAFVGADLCENTLTSSPAALAASDSAADRGHDKEKTTQDNDVGNGSGSYNATHSLLQSTSQSRWR